MKNETIRKQKTSRLPIMILGLLLFFLEVNFGQTIDTDIRKYEGFKEGVTYFIQTGDIAIDRNLEEMVSKYWTINRAEIIDFQQVIVKKDVSSFFVGIFEYEYSYSAGSTGALNNAYRTTEVMMFKDPEIKKGEIDRQETLSTVELTGPFGEESTKLANLVYAIQHIQDQLQFVFGRNHKKRLKFKDMLKERSESNISSIPKLTLYLDKDLLKENIDTDDELQEIYSHPFEFVDQNTLDQKIVDQEENGAYLRMMHWGNLKFVLFFSTRNNRLLYGKVVTGFNQVKVGPKFFKAINS